MALTRRSLTLLRRLRQDVGRVADEAVASIEQTWTSAWQQLAPAWLSAADAALAEADRNSRWPAPWRIARLPQVASAVLRTRQGSGQASIASARHVTLATTAAIATVVAAEPHIVAAQLRRAAAEDFARGIQRARVDALTADTRRRVTVLTRPLGADVARSVEQAFVRRPADLDAARVVARIQVVFQQGRQRAVAAAQTETLDAARAASAYVGQVNADTVAGWQWRSDLGPRTCPACWSMHGTLHPLRENGPSGHVSCRCTRMLLARDPDGGVTAPDGLALFRRMSRPDQLTVMGPTRLQLLDDGHIGWADLAVRQNNTGWRPSYVPRTVADLLRLAGHRQT
ncbi:hypothetical protein GCM10010172_06630 [Paractinoplanes ferrugineus]|uniref:Phage head morphogenesis domain-containing protein n=1 Tax=Paractinoplanes ferrugineus TaxID=113564 RepID=A0A919MIR4_9ACTN|nr:hypothetical protein [Actinoplanes ferrugineus]GIE16309.1 hypothetical protein Afe05nite_81490 [Actinoplanes ferrugineus]